MKKIDFFSLKFNKTDVILTSKYAESIKKVAKGTCAVFKVLYCQGKHFTFNTTTVFGSF